MPESSRRSWVLTVMSSRSRPAGRTRSSRWRHQSACRSQGRTDVSSRQTTWSLRTRATSNCCGVQVLARVAT
jgi:hypothetical protein